MISITLERTYILAARTVACMHWVLPVRCGQDYLAERVSLLLGRGRTLASIVAAKLLELLATW